MGVKGSESWNGEGIMNDQEIEFKKWKKNADFVIGAIAGALISIIYLLIATFANRTPNVIVLIVEIIAIIIFLPGLIQRNEINAFGFSIGFQKGGVYIILGILILFGILPFVF